MKSNNTKGKELLVYMGYEGTVEYDASSKTWHGKLTEGPEGDILGSYTYESSSNRDLVDAFCDAVEDYVYTISGE